jgi:flavin reductase (DIM6/NTAB) family NADH-FMN oxidoreductase RutF
MNDEFKVIDPLEITENPFKLISGDWMLVTAGDQKEFNTMTASWGGFGVLWHRKVCICFIRPSRYTYKFMEDHPVFTLSFFPDNFRDVLEYCGSTSGREINKVKETGLTPVFDKSSAIYFSEARLVLVCRKIYYDDLKPEHFLHQNIEVNYPARDYHRMYIGEVLKAMQKFANNG